MSSDDGVMCDERSQLLKREEDIPEATVPEPCYPGSERWCSDVLPEGDATVVVVILDEHRNVLGWDETLRDPRPIWVDGEPGLEFIIPLSIYIRNPGRPHYYGIVGMDDHNRCGVFTDEPVPIDVHRVPPLQRGDAVTFAEPIRVKLYRAPVEHIASPSPIISQTSDLIHLEDGDL